MKNLLLLLSKFILLREYTSEKEGLPDNAATVTVESFGDVGEMHNSHPGK